MRNAMIEMPFKRTGWSLNNLVTAVIPWTYPLVSTSAIINSESAVDLCIQWHLRGLVMAAFPGITRLPRLVTELPWQYVMLLAL